MTYRRWPPRTLPTRSPHPALTHAKLSSELSAVTRAVRSRDYLQLTSGLWLDRRSTGDIASLAIAYQKLYPDSVLVGRSAAVLHGFTMPGDSVPELWIGPAARRRKGLTVRRYDDLPSQAIREVSGVRVTSDRWTAFDLARFLPRDDAVVALEGMYTQGFPLDTLEATLDALRGRWGIRHAWEAFRATDTRSESPMESRTRLALADAGITGFESQVKVPSLGFSVDLGHRFAKVAIEYDGDDHFGAPRHGRDVKRTNKLRAEGWEVIVVTYDILKNHLPELLRQIRTALARRGFAQAA